MAFPVGVAVPAGGGPAGTATAPVETAYPSRPDPIAQVFCRVEPKFLKSDGPNFGGQRMANLGRWLGAVLLGTLAASTAHAQGMGAASAASTAASTATGTAGSAGGGANNIWSFLCMTPAQAAACKAKLCNCCLVKLFDAQFAIFNSMAGGCFKPCCPEVSPADLAKPADSAEGAAARVKQCEAGAKARAEAVRYLGTAPCAQFPEAEAALINALRADCSECVRLEAARALGRGCCCTKKVIGSLLVCVNGSNKDGNPRECSDRVKVMAYAALVHCLERYCESAPATPPEKAPPAAPTAPAAGSAAAKPVTVQQAAFYGMLDGPDGDRWVAEVRAALSAGPPKAAANMPLPAGHRNLANCLAQARAGLPPPSTPAPPVARPVAPPPAPRVAPPPPVLQSAEVPQSAAAPTGSRSLLGAFRRAASGSGGQ
jgi:hypothetical protein